MRGLQIQKIWKSIQIWHKKSKQVHVTKAWSLSTLISLNNNLLERSNKQSEDEWTKTMLKWHGHVGQPYVVSANEAKYLFINYSSNHNYAEILQSYHRRHCEITNCNNSQPTGVSPASPRPSSVPPSENNFCKSASIWFSVLSRVSSINSCVTP